VTFYDIFKVVSDIIYRARLRADARIFIGMLIKFGPAARSCGRDA